MRAEIAVLSWPYVLALSGLQLVVLALAAWRAPWRMLWRTPQRSHLVFASLVGLVLLWSIGGRVGAHASLHLLGLTTVTLLLGPSLALIVGTLAAVITSLRTGAIGIDLLADAALMVSLPVAVTTGLLTLALRYAPRNLFVYMLGVGFFGGALSMLAVTLAMMALFAIHGQAQALREWASPLILLAMFPEAFVNGAVVSGLAVYRPDWLRTLDERHFQL